MSLLTMTAALLALPIMLLVLAGGGDRLASGSAWPVHPPVLLAAFDPPAQPWLPGHRGIDLAAVAGQEVRAMASGRVAFAGLVAGKPVVVVQHGAGLRTTYEPVTGALPPGVRVRAGMPIGVVASAGGHCGGTCVHVGLRRGEDYLDPLLLLRVPVLKPVSDSSARG